MSTSLRPGTRPLRHLVESGQDNRVGVVVCDAQPGTERSERLGLSPKPMVPTEELLDGHRHPLRRTVLPLSDVTSTCVVPPHRLAHVNQPRR